MDFTTLEWGKGAKGSGGRKATKVRCNGSKSTSAVVLQGVRCIRKGGVETQRGVQSQRVRYKRNGFPAGAVRTQKDEPKPVLVRSIFYTFQAGKMLTVYFACFPVEKNHITA